MADNVSITPGAGTTVGSDELVINAVTVQVQRTKQAVGPDGTYVGDMGGRLLSAAEGVAVFDDPRNPMVRVQQTPTITTAIYAAGNAVGGLLTFAGAARATGAPCILEGGTVADKSGIKNPLTLVLFNQTFTASTDHTAFAPSAADLNNYVGHVNFSATDYGGFSANAAGAEVNLDIPIIPTGTSVFGQLYVTSGTPTYTTTTALVVSLTFRQL